MTDCQTTGSTSSRVAAFVLIFISFTTVVGMANHPQSFSEYGAVGGPLHGALITVAVVALAAFAKFAQMRGLGRFHVLLGLVFLSFGTLANFLAGSIDGYIVPNLLADGIADKTLLALCWELNQQMANSAIMASGAAFFIWGLDIAASRNSTNRVLGALGALSGLLPIILLATDIIDMKTFGAIIAYSIQAVFGLVAAWALLKTQ